jgi:hypothetical protein
MDNRPHGFPTGSQKEHSLVGEAPLISELRESNNARSMTYRSVEVEKSDEKSLVLGFPVSRPLKGLTGTVSSALGIESEHVCELIKHG